MAKDNNLQDFLLDVADNLRLKKGTSEPINAQDYSKEIRGISCYRKPIDAERKIRFIDFDGTVIYEQAVDGETTIDYETAESLVPNHYLLKFAEWNHDEETVSHSVDIGAIYDTIDGATYVLVNMEKGLLDMSMGLTNVSGNVLIEWGDGADTVVSGDDVYTHTYAERGEYWIRISGGEFRFPAYTFTQNNKIRSRVLNIYAGFNLTHLSGNTLNDCSALKYVSLQKQISLGNSFTNCVSLQNINIPLNLTSITSGDVFRRTTLKMVNLPKNINALNSVSGFRDNTALQRVVILNTSAVVSLGSSTWFQGTDCAIYVPLALLPDYKQATNWIDLADRIFAIEDM